MCYTNPTAYVLNISFTLIEIEHLTHDLINQLITTITLNNFRNSNRCYIFINSYILKLNLLKIFSTFDPLYY